MLGNTLPSPGHLDSANNINQTFCQRERKTFLRNFSQREKEVEIKTKEKTFCIETVVQINHGIGLVFVFFAKKNHFYFITTLVREAFKNYLADFFRQGPPPHPTLLAENHFAPKSLAELGGTPSPLSEKNIFRVLWPTGLIKNCINIETDI